MDSFKQLSDDSEGFVIPEQRLNEIEKRVHNSTQPVRFVVRTVDLYLPKAVDAMLALFGSGEIKRKRSNPIPPASGQMTDPASNGL